MTHTLCEHRQHWVAQAHLYRGKPTPIRGKPTSPPLYALRIQTVLSSLGPPILEKLDPNSGKPTNPHTRRHDNKLTVKLIRLMD